MNATQRTERAKKEAAEALRDQFRSMKGNSRKAARAVALVHLTILAAFAWCLWRTAALDGRVRELEAAIAGKPKVTR